VKAGMGSRSYTPGPLGHNEVSLRSFARCMREVIPESSLEHPPGAGWHTAASPRSGARCG
jgi:hypothetical protein